MIPLPPVEKVRAAQPGELLMCKEVWEAEIRHAISSIIKHGVVPGAHPSMSMMDLLRPTEALWYGERVKWEADGWHKAGPPEPPKPVLHEWMQVEVPRRKLCLDLARMEMEGWEAFAILEGLPGPSFADSVTVVTKRRRPDGAG